jgi:hypothetical protein
MPLVRQPIAGSVTVWYFANLNSDDRSLRPPQVSFEAHMPQQAIGSAAARGGFELRLAALCGEAAEFCVCRQKAVCCGRPRNRPLHLQLSRECCVQARHFKIPLDRTNAVAAKQVAVDSEAGSRTWPCLQLAANGERLLTIHHQQETVAESPAITSTGAVRVLKVYPACPHSRPRQDWPALPLPEGSARFAILCRAITCALIPHEFTICALIASICASLWLHYYWMARRGKHPIALLRNM